MDLHAVGPDEKGGARLLGVLGQGRVKGLVLVEARRRRPEVGPEPRVEDALDHRFGPDDQLGPGGGRGFAADHELVEELAAYAEAPFD